MKRSNLWRSVSALLMAGCICCTMPSCSDDDGPAVIEAAQPTASDYELNEAGEVALEFEVVPGDAQVDEVTIVGGNSAFESKGFTSKGNGKWVLNAKVTDFTQIKQENAITLSIAQTGGTPSNVLFSVYDPFAIENKFQLEQPKGFNYYSADKENLYATGLPVALKPLLPENLDLIDTENIKVVDGTPSHPIGVAHFIKTPLAGEVGFTLRINPEKLEEVQKAIPTFSPLDFQEQPCSQPAADNDSLHTADNRGRRCADRIGSRTEQPGLRKGIRHRCNPQTQTHRYIEKGTIPSRRIRPAERER